MLYLRLSVLPLMEKIQRGAWRASIPIVVSEQVCGKGYHHGTMITTLLC